MNRFRNSEPVEYLDSIKLHENVLNKDLLNYKK
jgi:hypothetical protein